MKTNKTVSRLHYDFNVTIQRPPRFHAASTTLHLRPYRFYYVLVTLPLRPRYDIHDRIAFLLRSCRFYYDLNTFQLRFSHDRDSFLGFSIKTGLDDHFSFCNHHNARSTDVATNAKKYAIYGTERPRRSTTTQTKKKKSKKT